MKLFILELRTALLATLVFVVVLCGLYPVTVWLGGRLLFPHQAAGSLITNEKGAVIGSSLIGQPFTGAKYFHPRPSAAGSGYDAAASSGTNLGPTSSKLTTDLTNAIVAYRTENYMSAGTRVPADAVTRSSSGLDPDISVSNALLQAPRVAAARRVPETPVRVLIDRYTTGPDFRIFGEARVNVLLLNLELDKLLPAS